MDYKKLSPLLATVLLLITPAIFPGVVLLSEVPEGIKQLIKKAQGVVQQNVDEYNAKTKGPRFLFEKGMYDPHITLAYVSYDEGGMADFQQKNAKLIDDLKSIAQNTNPITVSSTIQDAKLEIWPGKWEREYSSNKFKKYAILVAQLKPSPELLSFVEKLDSTLAQSPNTTKREFPFCAHVTIGWVYDQNDTDTTTMIDILKPKLEKAIAEERVEGNDFMIDAFKLSTHDKKQLIFPKLTW